MEISFRPVEGYERPAYTGTIYLDAETHAVHFYEGHIHDPRVKTVVSINFVKKKAETFDNIEFLGPIPQRSVLETTLKSDAVICIVDGSHPSTNVGISTKVLEAMVTGRPVIIPKGVYSAEIVEKYDCGIVAEYDKESISKAIITLRDNPDLCKKLGENGLKIAKERFNWKLQEEKLIKMYASLI